MAMSAHWHKVVPNRKFWYAKDFVKSPKVVHDAGETQPGSSDGLSNLPMFYDVPTITSKL